MHSFCWMELNVDSYLQKLSKIFFPPCMRDSSSASAPVSSISDMHTLLACAIGCPPSFRSGLTSSTKGFIHMVFETHTARRVIYTYHCNILRVHAGV